MAQAPYPYLVEQSVDNIAGMAQEMLEYLTQDPSLKAVTVSMQQGTLRYLPAAVHHLAVPLLRKYVDKGILVHMGPEWIQRALQQATTKGL